VTNQLARERPTIWLIVNARFTGRNSAQLKPKWALFGQPAGKNNYGAALLAGAKKLNGPNWRRPRPDAPPEVGPAAGAMRKAEATNNQMEQ